jgi:hypothetical protein
MLLWFGSFLALFSAIRLLAFDASGALKRPSTSHLTQELVAATQRLHSLEGQLQTGITPNEEQWMRLLALPPPWGELARQNILEIRRQGGSVLPSIVRFRLLLEQNRAALLEGSARTAQALGQAWISAAIVPILGLVLFWMVPGLDQRGQLWCAITVFACAWALLGARWIYRIAENARFGGLEKKERSWILAATVSGERFLSAIRTGNTPDVAYFHAHELLSREAPALASLWGSNPFQISAHRTEVTTLRDSLMQMGTSLKVAIQAALMEGRPCADRVEALIDATRTDIKSAIERQLSLAATRTMLPLFVCVAPGVFALLSAALMLSAGAAVE